MIGSIVVDWHGQIRGQSCKLSGQDALSRMWRTGRSGREERMFLSLPTTADKVHRGDGHEDH